jgi:hypothetical protein
MNGKTLLITGFITGFTTGFITTSLQFAPGTSAAIPPGDIARQTTHLRVDGSALSGIEVCGAPAPHASVFDIDGYVVARKIALSRQRVEHP